MIRGNEKILGESSPTSGPKASTALAWSLSYQADPKSRKLDAVWNAEDVTPLL